MDTLMSAHIVRFARIDEEIGLCSGTDAGLQESETVLRQHDRVVKALNDLKFAFQVLGFGEKRGLPIASGLVCGVSIYRSPYIASYHFQSITGPPATPTLNVSG